MGLWHCIIYISFDSYIYFHFFLFAKYLTLYWQALYMYIYTLFSNSLSLPGFWTESIEVVQTFSSFWHNHVYLPRQQTLVFHFIYSRFHLFLSGLLLIGSLFLGLCKTFFNCVFLFLCWINSCYLNEWNIDVEKRSVTSVFAVVDRCGQNLFLLLRRYC